MPTVQRKCRSKKRDGSPCPNNCRPGKRFCWVHDPELAGQRAEGRRRGGANRSRPAATLPPALPDLPLKTVADVRTALAEAYNGVRVGRIEARVGNCLAIIAGALQRAIEGGDLEQRMAALEGRQNTNGRRTA